MLQGSSCIITLLEVECTLDCSNSMSHDYIGLVLEDLGKGLRDMHLCRPGDAPGNLQLRGLFAPSMYPAYHALKWCKPNNDDDMIVTSEVLINDRTYKENERKTSDRVMLTWDCHGVLHDEEC